jgi:hypothetical protein
VLASLSAVRGFNYTCRANETIVVPDMNCTWDIKPNITNVIDLNVTLERLLLNTNVTVSNGTDPVFIDQYVGCVRELAESDAEIKDLQNNLKVLQSNNELLVRAKDDLVTCQEKLSNTRTDLTNMTNEKQRMSDQRFFAFLIGVGATYFLMKTELGKKFGIKEDISETRSRLGM